jgi:REP element-mobilizing transposase RayT
MARPLRILYPNAFYHVTCRGNDRRVIFRDDHDRVRFLERLRSARDLQRPGARLCTDEQSRVMWSST